MKKKALALALTSALVAPQAFAAQDTAGMHYTSAAEGFYASIRARYNSNNKKDGVDGSNSRIENSSTRFGVRGTNDLGGGLEGFYQLELGSDIVNGTNPSVRLGHVGLRGSFGSVAVGSVWNHLYNNTYGSTDIANVGSGNLAYTAVLPGRTDYTVQYDSPDINGLTAGFHATMAGADANDNDVDSWGMSGSYSVGGFSAAVGYSNLIDGQTMTTSAMLDENGMHESKTLSDYDRGLDDPVDPNDRSPGEIAEDDAYYNAAIAAATADLEDNDTMTTDDATAVVVKLGYAQDNWYVNGWWSETNNSDGNKASVSVDTNKGEDGKDDTNRKNHTVVQSVTSLVDTETFSVAGGMSFDKTSVYFVHEMQDNVGGSEGVEDSFTTIGVQYNLGSRTRVWAEYAAKDLDTNADADDNITIGLRHDF